MSNKISSLDQLKKIREAGKANLQVRTEGDNPNATILAVGMATCGIAAGARETMSALLEAIAANKLTGVTVIATGCAGLCYAEPLVEVREAGKEPLRYGNVDAARAKQIIEQHIMKGEFINDAIVGREVPRA